MYIIIVRIFGSGKSGNVAFNDNGDRISDYDIWQIKRYASVYSTWTEIELTKKQLDNVRTHDQGLIFT